MDKLRECPFCGSQNDFGIGRTTEDREGFPVYVYCESCGAQGPWKYTREKLAFVNTMFCAELTGWNTRTPDPLTILREIRGKVEQARIDGVNSQHDYVDIIDSEIAKIEGKDGGW